MWSVASVAEEGGFQFNAVRLFVFRVLFALECVFVESDFDLCLGDAMDDGGFTAVLSVEPFLTAEPAFQLGLNLPKGPLRNPIGAGVDLPALIHPLAPVRSIQLYS